jgi:hypothetical protein
MRTELDLAKKRGPREQPSPPCHRATKPVKAPPLGAPAERISRRSREHRPTIGALEPPQVTPMCLLGDSRWPGRPSIEQRVIPSGDQQRLCCARGTAIKNSEPTFNWCRARKSSFRYESSRLLPVGHITRAMTQPAFSSSIRSAVIFSSRGIALALGRDAHRCRTIADSLPKVCHAPAGQYIPNPLRIT